MALKYVEDKGIFRYNPKTLKSILKGEMTYK